MGRVTHFEITAKDPERASIFYTKVFDWEIRKWRGPMDYWFVMTGDSDKAGIDGGIMKRDNDLTSIHTSIDVDSIDETIEKIKSCGGTIIKEKLAIPGVGYIAYFKDTEGNIMSIMKSDPKVQE